MYMYCHALYNVSVGPLNQPGLALHKLEDVGSKLQLKSNCVAQSNCHRELLGWQFKFCIPRPKYVYSFNIAAEFILREDLPQIFSGCLEQFLSVLQNNS